MSRVQPAKCVGGLEEPLPIALIAGILPAGLPQLGQQAPRLRREQIGGGGRLGACLGIGELSPLELMRPLVKDSPATDLARRLWALGRAERLDALRDLGLTTVEIRPDEPLDAALAASSRRRPRAMAR